jgi:hypothetical protein
MAQLEVYGWGQKGLPDVIRGAERVMILFHQNVTIHDNFKFFNSIIC